MKHHDIYELAQRFLAETTQHLSTLGFDIISKWPEYPQAPDLDLRVPAELLSFQFTVMKDTQPDGSIRIAIQMYRHIFMGCGRMTADGFFISKDKIVRGLPEKDLWEVT